MRILLALTLAVVPTAALAHTGVGEATGFAYGFMHPIGGLDHLLAMIAVGILAGVLGGRALWLVPASFVSMMVAGFVLGAAGVELPMLETGIALSVLVIGAAAAWGRAVPTVAAMGLAGVFAVFHGVAHGAEMPATGGALDYAIGFVTATALLHAAGIALAIAATRLAGRYGRPLARGAGALIALSGVGILAGWL